MSNNEKAIIENKTFRRDLDSVLQRLKFVSDPAQDEQSRKSRERSLAITKLQEAIMWLGMDLKDLNTPNPYPSSYDPSTTKIEPTADGLTL